MNPQAQVLVGAVQGAGHLPLRRSGRRGGKKGQEEEKKRAHGRSCRLEAERDLRRPSLPNREWGKPRMGQITNGRAAIGKRS
jgi:hypothetical protein